MRTTVTYSEIWKIAYPIILGSIAQNLLNITDTAFLGRGGELALGAGAIGGIYYLVVVMLALGFGIGLQIIVARRNGEGRYAEIGLTVEHGFYFLFPLAVIMFSVMKFFSTDLLGMILESEGVYEATAGYIDYRSYGLFFVFTNFIFRSFYVGIAKTRVIIWSTALLAGVNIFLDYCLIFGNLGFPEMGIEGAALASVIAEATATVYFILYSVIVIPAKKYQLFRFGKFNMKLYLRIIRISFPVMMQNFFSIAAWLTFFLLVEKMGERDLAVSNIIRSFYVVLMIPLWGFSAATNTLVSNIIGQGRGDEVVSLVFKIVRISLAGVAIVVLMGFLFPDAVLRIYTNDPEIIQASLPALYVINIAALMLAAAFIVFSAVSGTGKTQISFLIEIAVITLYLVYTFFIINIIKGNISGVWTSEWVYAGLLFTLSFFYLKFGRWQESGRL